MGCGTHVGGRTQFQRSHVARPTAERKAQTAFPAAGHARACVIRLHHRPPGSDTDLPASQRGRQTSADPRPRRRSAGAIRDNRTHGVTPASTKLGQSRQRLGVGMGVLLPDSRRHGAAHRRVADLVDARWLLLDAFSGHDGVVAALMDEQACRRPPVRACLWANACAPSPARMVSWTHRTRTSASGL